MASSARPELYTCSSRVHPQQSCSTSKLTGAIERHGMNRAIDSTPTSVMLEELKAAGIALPTDEELTALAHKLCAWLAEYRRAILNQESAPSWFK